MNLINLNLYIVNTLLSAEPTQPHSEPPKDNSNTYQTVMKLFITPCGATLRKKCVLVFTRKEAGAHIKS